jgi:general stress protein 26
MTKEENIKIFEDSKIRTAWDSDAEKWYISGVDGIVVLPHSIDPAAYWRKLKQRLKEEENETVKNCNQLKMIINI